MCGTHSHTVNAATEEEALMERGTDGKAIGPKKKNYDESVDEPATLIENEPVDVESETPAESNVPVEQIEDTNKPNSPAFEE
jgi:hypothetical protein